MIVAAARTLARFHHDRLTLTVNDEQSRLDTPLLFVGNNDYRIDIAAPGHRESLRDGRLCVLVMRKKTRRGLVAASIRALLNRTRPDDMVRLDLRYAATISVWTDLKILLATPRAVLSGKGARYPQIRHRPQITQISTTAARTVHGLQLHSSRREARERREARQVHQPLWL